MNRPPIKRAARIYALAVVANLDGAGVESHDEDAVVSVAIAAARVALEKLGHDYSNLSTLRACIEAANRPIPDCR